MVVIFKGDSVYNIGDKFPLLSIPTDLTEFEEMELEDFQWWAYSDEFKKWRDKNPKEWVADSVDNSKYKEFSEILEEALSHSGNDYSSYTKSVSSFSDFSNALNEEEEKEETSVELSESERENYTKLYLAYNRLLKEGKIKSPLEIANLQKGDDLAVFVNYYDNEEIPNSTIALRFKVIGFDNEKKICIVDISESIPGGKIEESVGVMEILKRGAKQAINISKYVLPLIIIGGLGKFFIPRLSLRARLRLLRRSSRASGGITKGILNGTSKLLKKYKVIPEFKKMMKFGNIRNFTKNVSSKYKYLRGFKSLRTGKNVYTRVGSLLKGFGSAASKVSLKGGSRATTAIPLVGEILMVAQAAGALYNWYKTNQAPMYSDIKNEIQAYQVFDPEKIEVGRPVTVCWSQPAGSSVGGNLSSFLFNDETRTTMEIVKLFSREGNSIFAVIQMGSKELNAEISKHYLTLFAFDNDKKFETHWYDNDDLVFNVCYFDNLDSLATVTIFKGYLDWATLVSEYEKSSSQLIVADDNSPDSYKFYFSDSNGDIINVSGKKISSDELKEYSIEELEGMFIGKSIEKEEDSRIEVEKEGSEEEGEETGEEENPESSKEEKKVPESVEWNVRDYGQILDFNSFERDVVIIKEEEEKKDDSEEAGISEPQKVSVYLVEEKEYANPDLRDKFSTGKFKNFIIEPEYLDAKQNDPIEVSINTDENIINPKAGVYVYKEEKKKEKETTDKEEVANPAEPEKEDDYYVHSEEDDIVKKERRRATIIKDNPEGVNLMDEFLTDEQKKELKISDWKAITRIKIVKDRSGDIIKIKLINGNAKFGDRRKVITAKDGENFEIVKNFINEIKKRVKYDNNTEEETED